MRAGSKDGSFCELSKFGTKSTYMWYMSFKKQRQKYNTIKWKQVDKIKDGHLRYLVPGLPTTLPPWVPEGITTAYQCPSITIGRLKHKEQYPLIGALARL